MSKLLTTENEASSKPGPDLVTARRKRAARLSVLSNLGMIASNLAVGVAIGSVSVIAAALYSGMALFATLMTLVAVRLAARPADRDHPYGHGKYQHLTGIAEAFLVFVGAGVIIYEVLHKFGQPSGPGAAIWGVGVMAFAATVNFWVSRYLYKAGRETDSPALVSDAAHFRTGAIIAAGVMISLSVVWVTGWAWLDPLTALLVALLIIRSGWDSLLHSVGGLLDPCLPEQEEQQIVQIIESFAPRYINYHELRTRQSGPDRHIDFHLVVANHMTVEEAHLLCDSLEEQLDRALGGAVIHIHVEPESVCTGVEGVYRCNPANFSGPSGQAH